MVYDIDIDIDIDESTLDFGDKFLSQFYEVNNLKEFLRKFCYPSFLTLLGTSKEVF
jgi:hypothetical protein